MTRYSSTNYKMLKGFIFSLAILGIFFIAGFLFFAQNQLDTKSQEEFVIKESIEDERPFEETIIEYGSTPVFAENLRFNHNEISYYINKSCNEKRKKSMKEAFNIFENEFKIISFYEESNSNADILVSCSTEEIEINEHFFAAGEGGPSKIINTSGFKTIQEGKISLYKDTACNYPVVELHELGHVFGFDHSKNKKSIMYNVTACDQRITSDMVDLINNLYQIKPLPDAVIHEVKAIKKGRYVDFNVTLINEGLIAIKNISLTISSEGKPIEEVEFGEIDVGYARTLRAGNVKLPSSSANSIEFTIDKEKKVEEFKENNNFIELILQ